MESKASRGDAIMKGSLYIILFITQLLTDDINHPTQRTDFKCFFSFNAAG